MSRSGWMAVSRSVADQAGELGSRAGAWVMRSRANQAVAGVLALGLVGSAVWGSAGLVGLSRPEAEPVLTGGILLPAAFTEPARAPQSPVVWAPDRESLEAQAATSGQPVEVGRWASGSVWAMPDGTWSMGITAGPSFVAEGEGTTV